MAHNIRIRPPGTWVLGSTVDMGEFESIDSILFKCLNADDGGTWAPVEVITIGGAGLNVTGDAAFYASFSVFGNSQAQFQVGTSFFEGTFFAAGKLAQFAGTVQADGNVTLGSDGSDTLTVNATASFAANVSVTGETTVANLHVGATSANSLTVSATSVFSSAASFNGDVALGNTSGDALAVNATSTFEAPVTFNDPIVMASDASVRTRIILGTTGTVHYAVAAADSIYVNGIGASGNQYRIDTAGAGTGNTIEFCVDVADTTSVAQVVRDSDNHVFGNLHNASGAYSFMQFKYVSGAWRLWKWLLNA